MKEKIIIEDNQSPLSLKEIKRIEELNLSILERHHLRLLAHCLFSFKAMDGRAALGKSALPSEQEQLQWCLNNPNLDNDQEFIDLLIQQFSIASCESENIAENLSKAPMDLTLDDLIKDALNHAKKN